MTTRKRRKTENQRTKSKPKASLPAWGYALHGISMGITREVIQYLKELM